MGDMADYHNDIEMQLCEDANEAYDFPVYSSRRCSMPHSGDPYTTSKERQQAWSEQMAKHNHHNIDCQGRAAFEAYNDDEEIDVTAMQTPKRQARKDPSWKQEVMDSIPTGAGSTNKRGYRRNHIPEIIEPTAQVDEWGGIPDE